MTSYNSPPHPSSRRGIGAVFLFGIIVIVVLAAIIGIQQLQSMTSATRDTTALLDLTHKCTLVAESAIDEGCVGALRSDLNNPDGPSDGLFLKLRSYLPPTGSNPTVQTEDPVFNGATPFVVQAKYAPKITYDAIKNDETLKLSSYEPSSNPVYYGPLDWHPITSQQDGAPLVLMPESNESVGILGFAHTVYAKGAGFLKNIDQSAQFSRPFKCLLMGPPWPYHKYSLFVLELYGEDSEMQPFKEMMTIATDPLTTPHKGLFTKSGIVKSGIAAFYRKVLWHNTLVKSYTNSAIVEALKAQGQQPTSIPTASIDLNLNSPIVFEGDANGTPLDPLLSTDQSVAQLKADLDPKFEDQPLDAYLAVFGDASRTGDLQKIVDYLVKAGNDLKAIGAKIQVRNVSAEDHKKYFAKDCPIPAFYTISPQAWMARATRIYKGPADLEKVMNEDKSEFRLAGVYYFQGTGPYTLDKPYRGKGILVFEDNVTVGNFVPVSANQESHAVVVAIPAPGKIDTSSIVVTSDVTADLLAPYGTITAPGVPRIPTHTIRGSVLVRYLADAASGSNSDYFGSSAAAPMFPTIDRGKKADYDFEPPKPGGGAYDKAYAKHMQLFLDPGYVKRVYRSKRNLQ